MNSKSFKKTLLYIIIFLAIWLAIDFFIAFKKEKSPPLKVDFLDVGQGDATLITYKNDYQILIDGGPDGKKLLTQVSKIVPPMDRKIEMVILTHPDFDHLGGLVELAQNYEIGAFLDSGQKTTTDAFKKLEKIIEEKNIKHEVLTEGSKIDLEDLHFIVFNPDKTLTNADNPDNSDNTNSQNIDKPDSDIDESESEEEINVNNASSSDKIQMPQENKPAVATENNSDKSAPKSNKDTPAKNNTKQSLRQSASNLRNSASQKSSKNISKERNDQAVVLRLEYGRNSFLFTADVDVEVEKDMVADGENVDVDWLKVAHHGSKYSTNNDFLNKVTPQDAIISVGKENRYGHPNKETLDRLSSHNIKIFRTDEKGTIEVDCWSKELACAIL